MQIQATLILQFGSPRIFPTAALITSGDWKTSNVSYRDCSAARWMWSRNRSVKSVFKNTSTGIAPLPSEKPVRRFMDIVEHARAILQYTAGMDSKAFEEDRKTYDAVERCLERISEAAAKLGEQ